MKQRIVQRIVHPFRQLLRQRLHVVLFHQRRRRPQIRRQHKRAARRLVHPVRPKRAAHRSVPVRVVARVPRHRDHQLSVLLWNLPKDRPLHELHVRHPQRRPCPFRRQHIPVPRRNRHRHRPHLRLPQQRMPSARHSGDRPNRRAQQGVRVLRCLPVKGRPRKHRRPQHSCHIARGIQRERLARNHLRLELQPHRHQHRRNHCRPVLRRIPPRQRYCTVARLVPEGRRRPLSVTRSTRQHGENHQQKMRISHQKTIIASSGSR